jgi:hypothetical protein
LIEKRAHAFRPPSNWRGLSFNNIIMLLSTVEAAASCNDGRSKLRIPAARDGTARNMNTVAKLAAMAA